MDATFNEGVACVVAWNMVPQRRLVDAFFMQSNLFHHTCFYRSSSKVKCTVSSKKIRLCTNMYIFDFPKIILMLAVWKKYFIKQNSKVIEEQEVDFDLWSLTTQSYRQINSKRLMPMSLTQSYSIYEHITSVLAKIRSLSKISYWLNTFSNTYFFYFWVEVWLVIQNSSQGIVFNKKLA